MDLQGLAKFAHSLEGLNKGLQPNIPMPIPNRYLIFFTNFIKRILPYYSCHDTGAQTV